MKLTTNIANFFRGGKKHYHGAYIVPNGWEGITCHAYAESIFYSLVKLLSDLDHDVTWQFDGSNLPAERAFIRFFNTYATTVDYRLRSVGFVVVKHSQVGEGPNAAHEFGIAKEGEDYRKSEEDGWTVFSRLREDIDIYAMMSPTYKAVNKSEKTLAAPMMELLDNTLNASNTVSSRLGAMVVCSPKNPSNAPMSVTLDEQEKKELEEQISKEYGMLQKQKQIMVMPREMSFQIISLASLDLRTMDKVKMAVCAIADILNVPANQCALIDANSSKSLSNGSELREGDYNKYQSFERYLDSTWVQLARDCKLAPGMTELTQGETVGSYYTIYNKPKQSNE